MIGGGEPAPKPSLRERRRVSRIHWAAGIAVAAAAGAAAVLAIVFTRDPPSWPQRKDLPLSACTIREVPARCGRLVVPENPGDPNGRRISLRVVVIPSPKQPAAGALFYLEGGPGGAATDSISFVNDTFAKVNAHRDVVLVDQRGTGGSHPLACPQEHVRLHGPPEIVADYVRRCFAGLDGDPRFYTSALAAHDLEAVRRGLGYGRVDLFGGSYGATLAQIYERLYPRSVRTMTLDGVSLLSVPLYELEARNGERALDDQLARCAAQPSCRRAFPDTRREIDELLARGPVRADPPGFPSTTMPSDGIAHTLQALLEVPYHAARLPALVHQAVRGDPDLLAVEYVTHVGVELDRRARLAMVWEILCSEPWARYGVAATERNGDGSFLAASSLRHARLFRSVCARLPKGVVPPGSETLRPTNVPVLFLSGGDDPVDPPANLRGRTALYPNSRLLVEPAAGHGVIADGCFSLVAAQFVERGSARRLDLRCLKALRPPPFALVP
jgi:pimeloyl-ACP methyl ester carboxylesterase